MKGNVVRVFSEKKFGFIRDEQGQEYFFHTSDLRGALFDELVDQMEQGQVSVTFNPATSDKGLRAEYVVIDRPTE